MRTGGIGMIVTTCRISSHIRLIRQNRSIADNWYVKELLEST